MSYYFCTNCGADLGNQRGFRKSTGTWTCTKCGQLLIDPKYCDENAQFDSVAWYCDECGAFLNKQRGFNDWCGSWKCKKCGHVNPISEDEIYESDDDYRSRNYDESACSNSTSFDGNDFDNNGDEDSCYEDNYDDSYDGSDYEESDDDECDDGYDNDDSDDFDDDGCRNEYIVTKTVTKTRYVRRGSSGTIVAIIALLILVLGGIGYFKYQEYKKLIDVGFSYDDAAGKNYVDVENMFAEAGFTNVHSYAQYDLMIEDIEEEYLAKEINIRGATNFDSHDRYPYDARVEIVYHVLKEIHIPISSKSGKKMLCDDLVQTLENAGFVNINTIAEKDLIKGWIKKDGSVEEISVNGDTKFSQDALYRPDVEIVITYHTFKEKEKE